MHKHELRILASQANHIALKRAAASPYKSLGTRLFDRWSGGFLAIVRLAHGRHRRRRQRRRPRPQVGRRQQRASGRGQTRVDRLAMRRPAGRQRLGVRLLFADARDLNRKVCAGRADDRAPLGREHFVGGCTRRSTRAQNRMIKIKTEFDRERKNKKYHLTMQPVPTKKYSRAGVLTANANVPSSISNIPSFFTDELTSEKWPLASSSISGLILASTSSAPAMNFFASSSSAK